MPLSKTDKAAMKAVEPQFRFAWTRALAALQGAPVVASLAQMLEFPDTWELALSALSDRAGQYPKPVATQVLFALRRDHNDDRRFQAGALVLKKIDRKVLNAVVSTMGNNDVPQPGRVSWDTFARKFRAALR